MRIADGWPEGTILGLPEPRPGDPAVLAIHRLSSFHGVEDAAAADLLGHQAPSLAVWGDAAYMAISELCDNAIQHGLNDLGAYVAADRADDPQPCFRLVVADLGIGIPEHIRAQHPEWQDDAAAISRVLDRGVTGTGDPHRGNGYAEAWIRVTPFSSSARFPPSTSTFDRPRAGWAYLWSTANSSLTRRS